MHSLGASPSGKIDAARRIGIDGEAIRTIRALRQTNRLPMLCAIGRAIDRAIAVVADTTVFRTARHYDVQRPIRASSQSPGEGLILRDSLILQGPALSAIIAAAYTTFVCGDGIVPPHFGTGQVVGIAVHAPGAAAHFGIKHHPVSR